jgi:2-haloacid dehalogenase
MSEVFDRRRFLAAMAVTPAASLTRRGRVGWAGGEGAQGSSSVPAALRDVRVLAFDTFGTVVDWRSGVIAEGEALGKAKGLTVDWAKFADAWRGAYGPSMARVRKGELPWTKLDVLHRMSLDTLLPEFGITTLTEAEKAHFNRAWHRLNAWPGAVDGLKRLKTKFVLTPLSNGNVSLLTNMAKHTGLPWDCVLSAEIAKHYKPDPETYLMVAEIFDLQPSQVMMVAAHEGDLQAAKKLGLRTSFVHRPHEFGPSRVPALPADGTFDLVTKDFGELATRLGV